MTVLAVGGTGNIGSLVVRELAGRGTRVRALSRDPDKEAFPSGVEPVRGDMMDPDSLRGALDGASTMFLLSPVAPTELGMALVALALARDAGVRGVVYFSMINANRFLDCPHAAAKNAAELAIARLDLPATILRPNYFFQNDLMIKDAILGGTYAMPIGSVGVEMVDARDIAEVAARELMRREEAAGPLPRELIEIVGPERMTGDMAASIWSEVLQRRVAYAGDDISGLEAKVGAMNGPWIAYDQVLMFRGFHREGMLGSAGSADRLTAMLGRPLRRYRDFATETAREWGRQPPEATC